MFGRKKTVSKEDIQKKALKDISYPPKIILAWAKALEGNAEIADWLLNNGFKELVMANHAIRLKMEARNWLLENGFPHLMAFVNAAEGNEGAQKWLLRHNFKNLYHMALAIDEEMESWDWLGKNVDVDLFLLTKTIKKIKDEIEEKHNDIHTFGTD
jgi:hypothetical protein